MGAPKGNTNSNKSNRLWADTIRRAVTQANSQRLRNIAEKLLDEAENGNIMAMKEIGDRLDGKVAQTVLGPGENGEHVLTGGITVNFVSAPTKKK
jgi:hypothetical protein